MRTSITLIKPLTDTHRVAWDHVSNIYKEIRPPGKVTRCMTEGTKVVAFLWRSENILIWDMNKGQSTIVVEELAASQNLDRSAAYWWPRNLTCIVHPTLDNTIFLATAYPFPLKSSGLKTLRWAVYEYRDSRHVESYFVDFPGRLTEGNRVAEWMEENHGIVLAKVKIQGQRSSSYGRYAIGLLNEYPPNAFLVEFDVYHRHFICSSYRDLGSFAEPAIGDREDIQPWNGSIAHFDRASVPLYKDLGPTDLNLQESSPTQSRGSRTAGAIPWQITEFLPAEKGVPQPCLRAFARSKKASSQLPVVLARISPRMSGDDDFMVMVASGGFAV
jgi:hypothetical protein